MEWRRRFLRPQRDTSGKGEHGGRVSPLHRGGSREPRDDTHEQTKLTRKEPPLAQGINSVREQLLYKPSSPLNRNSLFSYPLACNLATSVAAPPCEHKHLDPGLRYAGSRGDQLTVLWASYLSSGLQFGKGKFRRAAITRSIDPKEAEFTLLVGIVLGLGQRTSLSAESKFYVSGNILSRCSHLYCRLKFVG